MNQPVTNWDEDLPPDPEEEYQALVRALRRTEGFGLLFVRCSPAKGNELIQAIQTDLPQKRIEVLNLDQPIPDSNVYHRVETFLQDKGQVDVLFIQGLEQSLLEYEDAKRHLGWSDTEARSYSWKGAPKILTNLNQQRERFRNNFDTCFVFLVPLFVIRYLIHRAPDFFDWRSGIFELPTDLQTVEQESQRIVWEGNYEKYLLLTPQERQQKFLKIQELLEEPHQTSERKVDLFSERGILFAAAAEHKSAIDSYDHALKIKPDDHQAWFGRGYVLDNLGRYEDAIDSYDHALQIKPDYHQAWYNRGIALGNLGRTEEAIDSYDHALQLKPDDHDAWYNRGIALRDLGRYQEAIDSYDHALQIKPDKDEAWYNRGIALGNLGRDQEAIDSYDHALQLKPDDHEAWYGKACCYGLQGDVDKVIECLGRAIELDPKYREIAKTDADFDAVRESDRFQRLLDDS